MGSPSTRVMGDVVLDYFDGVVPPRGERPFSLMVAVCGRIDSPGPRDDRWEYTREMGSGLIDKVLNREPIGKGPHLFIFPCRWMVPAEQQNFVARLSENPDAAKFGRVEIVTKEPFIVGDCLAGECRIVTIKS